MMKLAAQAMWDPQKFHEIMSESETIIDIEAIMEDDNINRGEKSLLGFNQKIN